MKKIITLILLVSFISNIAQCLPPTNLTLDQYNNTTDATLSWTDNQNGSNLWEVGVLEYYSDGPQLPTWSFDVSNNSIFIPGYYSGCIMYFVRAKCSLTVTSSWVAIGNDRCPVYVLVYSQTLNNDSFSLENKENSIKLFPNPAKNTINIKTQLDNNIESISIFNLIGQLFLEINQSNPKSIDISQLQTGTYIMKIKSNLGYSNVKFIKE